MTVYFDCTLWQNDAVHFWLYRPYTFDFRDQEGQRA